MNASTAPALTCECDPCDRPATEDVHGFKFCTECAVEIRALNDSYDPQDYV